MNMNPLPRILVSGSLQSAQAGSTLNTALAKLAKSAFDRLRQAGIDFDFVEASLAPALSANWPQNYSGFLILGGADMDPGLYGQTPHPSVYGVNRKADNYELALISMALKANIPVLGICRGLQLINVALGGSLIQDLGQPSIHSSTANNSIMNKHAVHIAPNTPLAQIYPSLILEIQSGHHQAIGKIGKNLTLAATAPDNIAEAISSIDTNQILGVQWHPEDEQAPAEDFICLVTKMFNRH